MIKRVCDICGKDTGNVSFKVKRRVTSPGEKYTHPNSSWVRIDVCEDCYSRIANSDLLDTHPFYFALSSVIEDFDNNLLDTKDPDIKMTPKTYQIIKKIHDDLTGILERSGKNGSTC